MNILFVHQNFPGQYRHLAPALAARPGYRVVALRLGEGGRWQGVDVIRYQVKAPDTVTGHPWLADLHPKMVRAEAAARQALTLREQGFHPDVIIGHPGWGETLLLHEVWPGVPVGLYCEFFYGSHGADVNFDPEFPPTSDPLTNAGRLLVKNVNQLLALDHASRGISPTQWQRSLYPKRIQPTIEVIHDGIDTETVRPNASVSMRLSDKATLTRDDEIITFVNRNLEPYRGYHQFMRALPELLRRRPKARVLIVGGDGTSYGAAPPPGQTWRNIFLDEVKTRLDMSRVHFVGKLAYSDFVQMLQLSRVHVYLTYPFVLSWSLLETMSAGGAIVASRTAPVEEVVTDKESGLLVDFFNHDELVDSICTLLDDPDLRERFGRAAREHVVRQYDLKTVCLPRQLEWVHGLCR